MIRSKYDAIADSFRQYRRPIPIWLLKPMVKITDVQVLEKKDQFQVIVKATDTINNVEMVGASTQRKTFQGKPDPFALQKALSKAQRNSSILDSSAIFKMVRYLREGDPNNYGTLAVYTHNISKICELNEIMENTPDSVVSWAKNASAQGLRERFSKLNEYWYMHGIARYTRNQRISSLKTLLKANGIDNVNLVRIKVKTQNKYRIEGPIREELRRSFEQCRNTTDKLILVLGAECGQRAGTITKLSWGHSCHTPRKVRKTT